MNTSSRNIGDHIHGDEPGTTRPVGRLRYFIPKHTHLCAVEDPIFKGQNIVSPADPERLQERLDDGTWIDVPIVIESY